MSEFDEIGQSLAPKIRGLIRFLIGVPERRESGAIDSVRQPDKRIAHETSPKRHIKTKTAVRVCIWR